ncbi:MAG: hypothetical protein LCH38_02270 [Proteobacteria bacterium]|nr:hypothetical protein [Pseudomonadota bacterium]
MTILMNDATNLNVSILKRTNDLFGITQKRVASGKKVFTSADDTTRFAMSESVLGRSRQIADVNNNIALGLATLEATDKTLKAMIGNVDSALDLANRALNEGASGLRSAHTTADIQPSAIVSGVSIGSKFSITSDGGRNFTYTFSSTTVTWGEIVDALNAANIGVIARFVPGATAGEKNIEFFAPNQKDFSFDAISDQNVMDDLVGLTSPSGQTFNATNLFANGLAAPGANETGFTITYGGRVTGTIPAGVTPATVIAAGSSIVFEDGNGGFRTLNYGAATTVGAFIADVTALGSGIKAELVNQTGGAAGPRQLRLRNLNGGDMKIVAASGDFASGGSVGFNGITVGYTAPLSSNNALRLAYGEQYDALLSNINLMIANNPVPNGRNLLKGENINVIMDEFAGTPLSINGVLVTAAGYLTMAQPGASWVNEQNIQTSSVQARQAQTLLRELQAQFATFNNYIRSRYEMNKSFQSEMKTQGDELVAADVSEESAALIALQTRQQFAVQSLSISNENSRSLLSLLGG